MNDNIQPIGKIYKHRIFRIRFRCFGHAHPCILLQRGFIAFPVDMSKWYFKWLWKEETIDG